MPAEARADVLVIGCGIAGAAAAIRFSGREDLQVTVTTGAEDSRETATYYAQGGISYRWAVDSAELLAGDITRAGDGLNDPGAVAALSGQRTCAMIR